MGAPPTEAEAYMGGEADLAVDPPLPSGPSHHSAQASVRPVLEPEHATALPIPSEQRLRLIYTAQLSLLVDHDAADDSLDRLVATTLQFGGYLSIREDRRLVVRVPSAQFHEVFASFEQHGEVSARNVRVQDVSEEYHDLEVRIVSLTVLLARMRGLLERATTLDEILRIESELGRIVTEIDQARGRLRFLGNHAAWSTVRIAITERPAPTTPEVRPEPSPGVTRLPIDWLNQNRLDHLLNLEN